MLFFVICLIIYFVASMKRKRNKEKLCSCNQIYKSPITLQASFTDETSQFTCKIFVCGSKTFPQQNTCIQRFSAIYWLLMMWNSCCQQCFDTENNDLSSHKTVVKIYRRWFLLKRQKILRDKGGMRELDKVVKCI